MRVQSRVRFPHPALLLGPALLVIAACGTPEHSAEPGAAPVTLAAELAVAERGEAPSVVELLGLVEAEKTAAVSARVMAPVTAVHVQAGDVVRRGQPLLEIDPQAAEGQLAQARGALAQARAALALAERNRARYEALAATEAASELEMDMARMQHEQALGAVEQAEGAVAAAASVASDSRVVAPFAGRVTRRLVEVGDLAAPGRPLLMVESEGGKRITLTVPESVMARAGLEVGSELQVRIDTRPELGTLRANVVEMSPGADPASHAFQVKAALPASGVPSGSAGRAQVEVERRTAVSVPRTAVLRQGGLSLVVVRDGDGRAASRVVTLGEELAGDRVEVLSGLVGGETVALGLESVPPAGARLEAAAGRGESA